MQISSFSFQLANKYLPKIVLIGLILGCASYALGIWPTIGQSLFQQVAISLVIGYGLVLLADNLPSLVGSNSSNIMKYGLLFLLSGVIGIIGTEVEELVKCYAFNQGEYQFLSLRGHHFFNIILGAILGYSTLTLIGLKKETKEQSEISDETAPSQAIDNNISESLHAIPIRQGESTVLYPIDKVIYFESYDNYSFLFDTEGKKFLCNYSLLHLEKRLVDNFLRVHRKYLVHKDLITKITPQIKSRYTLEFNDIAKSTITSSTSYADVVKSLIKL